MTHTTRPRLTAPILDLRPHRSLVSSPRHRLLESVAEWITPRLATEIPGLPAAAIRVDLVPRTSLPGGAVASFQVGSRAFPARRWQVTLAYGTDLPDPELVESWCVSLPHELLHLRDFAVRYHGQHPIDLDWPSFIADWNTFADASEGTVEDEARRIIRYGYAPSHRDELQHPLLPLGITAWRRQHAPTAHPTHRDASPATEDAAVTSSRPIAPPTSRARR